MNFPHDDWDFESSEPDECERCGVYLTGPTKTEKQVVAEGMVHMSKVVSVPNPYSDYGKRKLELNDTIVPREGWRVETTDLFTVCPRCGLVEMFETFTHNLQLASGKKVETPSDESELETTEARQP